MDMRRITAERRITHWAQIVRGRVESGLSVKTFCEKAGIHENVFFYWQRKIRNKACEVSTMATTEARLVPQGFTEVKILDQANPQTHVAANRQQIRIEYAGLQIIADSGYPTGNLAYLLKELVHL